jgi:hypothetical protein
MISYEFVKKITMELNQKIKTIDNLKKVTQIQKEIEKNYLIKEENYKKKKEKEQPKKINIIIPGFFF